MKRLQAAPAAVELSAVSSPASPLSIERAPRIPGAHQADALAATSRLDAAGWSLIPLGNGEDGKSPSFAFKKTRRFPVDAVQNRMRKLGTAMFAVRLDGVVVVDADTDNPETRAYIEKRFGNSPHRTATARGIHEFWAKGDAKIPRKVRLPGVSIDFKSGVNQYVVGPGSYRSDGVHYRSSGTPLPAPSELPAFVDMDARPSLKKASPAPAVLHRLDGPNRVHQRVPKGERNAFLVSRSVAYAGDCDSREELVAELLAAREHFCEAPESVSDDEVLGIAGWAWTCRMENRLFRGKRSMVKIPRLANEVLLPLPGGSDAFALLGYLSAAWQHRPNVPFAVVPAAIKASGKIHMGRNQIYAAIKLLLATHFLVLIHTSRGAKDPSRYLLGDGGREGGEVSNYIGPFSGDEGEPA